ncbi:hypothetical protein BR93DRAFT_924265 [Coniochaeta sp. PMI_546]|nr:hypothetical protein BR93DRAFT_924265 [Coniochaeta sp. PMI_546]
MARDNNEDAPSGEIHDSSYVSKDQKVAPVISDDTPVDEAYNDETTDTDAQLERDERDAIDEDNIVEERTRHAKPVDTYREPGDTEGLE